MNPRESPGVLRAPRSKKPRVVTTTTMQPTTSARLEVRGHPQEQPNDETWLGRELLIVHTPTSSSASMEPWRSQGKNGAPRRRVQGQKSHRARAIRKTQGDPYNPTIGNTGVHKEEGPGKRKGLTRSLNQQPPPQRTHRNGNIQESTRTIMYNQHQACPPLSSKRNSGGQMAGRSGAIEKKGNRGETV